MKFKRLPVFCKSLMAALCLMSAGLAFTACDDSEDPAAIDLGQPYDPNQPITITNFSPEKGGYQDRVIVYGSNFGNNKDNVKLTIGGKDVVIATIRENAIYGYVPSQAYDAVERTGEVDDSGSPVRNFVGEIRIVIDDGNGNTQEATASRNFIYTPKTVVGTLLGSTNDYETQGEIFGSFEEARGFAYESSLMIDPLDDDIMYITYDKMPNEGAWGGYIVKVDFRNHTVSRAISASKFNNKRLQTMAFSPDGSYMLVSSCCWDQQWRSQAVYYVKRDAQGGFSDNSDIQCVARYQAANAIVCHPVNGEFYFAGYDNSAILRFDMDDYFAGHDAGTWTGMMEDGAYEEIFRVFDIHYTMWLTIHPSGNYMYITCDNVHVVYRSDYDWERKTFTTPYVAFGTMGGWGYKDAVGNEARIANTKQGCFVPNQQYIDEGRADIYDYYFADCGNYCIRKATPECMVSTVAGRGQSTDGNIWGIEDGDPRQDARFRQVSGCAWDAKRNRLYTVDPQNYRVRYLGSDVVDDGTVDGDLGEDAAIPTAKAASKPVFKAPSL